MEKNAQGPQWAMVEIMGFRKHVGIVSEAQRFGATMMRLEALGTDGTFEEHLYGGSSIFHVQPITEEAARRSVLPKSYQPCDEFTPSKVLPTACGDCGHDENEHRPPFALTQGATTEAKMLRDRVFDGLRRTDHPLSPETIAATLGEELALIEEALASLAEDAIVERDEDGLYVVVDADEDDTLPDPDDDEAT